MTIAGTLPSPLHRSTFFAAYKFDRQILFFNVIVYYAANPVFPSLAHYGIALEASLINLSSFSSIFRLWAPRPLPLLICTLYCCLCCIVIQWSAYEPDFLPPQWISGWWQDHVIFFSALIPNTNAWLIVSSQSVFEAEWNALRYYCCEKNKDR